ncbi:MAG: hypothetical protein M3325_14675, partial [Actinomycetota bacterium]|nr:hypothetical protein [Actinomycetota bacterium]
EWTDPSPWPEERPAAGRGGAARWPGSGDQRRGHQAAPGRLKRTPVGRTLPETTGSAPSDTNEHRREHFLYVFECLAIGDLSARAALAGAAPICPGRLRLLQGRFGVAPAGTVKPLLHGAQPPALSRCA